MRIVILGAGQVSTSVARSLVTDSNGSNGEAGVNITGFT